VQVRHEPVDLVAATGTAAMLLVYTRATCEYAQQRGDWTALTEGGRRWENGTENGVGGGRRAAHTDDALWLMKIVRQPACLRSSAGVSCEAGKQRHARREAARAARRGVGRPGAGAAAGRVACSC
jgi:hypothetical protein